MDKYGLKIVFLWIIGELCLFSQHFEGKIFLGDEAGIEAGYKRKKWSYSLRGAYYNFIREHKYPYRYGSLTAVYWDAWDFGIWFDRVFPIKERLLVQSGVSASVRYYRQLKHEQILAPNARGNIGVFLPAMRTSLNYLLKEKWILFAEGIWYWNFFASGFLPERSGISTLGQGVGQIGIGYVIKSS